MFCEEKALFIKFHECSFHEIKRNLSKYCHMGSEILLTLFFFLSFFLSFFFTLFFLVHIVRVYERIISVVCYFHLRGAAHARCCGQVVRRLLMVWKVTQQQMGSWLCSELGKVKAGKGDEMCTTLHMLCPLKQQDPTSTAPMANQLWALPLPSKPAIDKSFQKSTKVKCHPTKHLYISSRI